jgi:predicted phage terminase large subunit-like protein
MATPAQLKAAQAAADREVADYERKLFAAKRLMVLRSCQDDLLTYTQLSMPDPLDPDNPLASRYQTHKIHRYLCDQLMKVERGEILRLIICMQPRVGKSELVSRKFPTWFTGRDPYRQSIIASYGDDLATEFGRECRHIMRGAFYQQVFPGVSLRRGNAASDRIQTHAGGVLTFAGRNAGILGKGADLLLVDDPVKNSDEARSKLQRDALWTWFWQVAMTRVMGVMGRVVICMSRWHEDDLVGRLTNPRNSYYDPEEAKKWTVINIPAFAEADDPLGRAEGEILWPERTPEVFLNSMRRMDPAGFSAQFMGRPSPPEGNLFKRKNIQGYQAHQLPKNLRYYAASDHAVSLAANRDPTCMGVVGVDKEDNVWILPDLIWRQLDAEQQVEGMLDLMVRYKPLLWTAERGHISLSLGPFLRKRMNEEKTYITIDERVPSKDKQTRAQAIAGRMSMGKVYLPKFAPWYEDAVDELLNFPNGTHDDFVDFIALIGLSLDTLNRPNTSVPPVKQAASGSIQWILQSAERLRRSKAAEGDRYLH